VRPAVRRRGPVAPGAVTGPEASRATMSAMRGRCLVLVVVVVIVAATGCASGHHEVTRPTIATAARPSALVDPFMGTGIGGASVGEIHAFPGADVPFGMMQWGPDTAPVRAAGGGYRAGSSAIGGFSLTHLSGPGCAVFGDVPVLPTVGAVTGAPEAATARFAPADEHATPGSYRVELSAPRILVELGVSSRSGLARFTFPRRVAANLLVKVADSAYGLEAVQAHIVGDHELEGSVVAGHFCDTAGTYMLAFAARFDHPFLRFATWSGATIAQGSRVASGPHSGAVLTFDTSDGQPIEMKVGISFVGVANARANLDAEIPGWDLGAVTDAARARWDALLGRIAIEGGTADQRATFESALYHSLLHPNVFSDVNGQYEGFDHRVHTATGYTQYANYSGWDIYRSQIPLVALLAPTEAGDMMQSLVADARQSGFLPKWALANFETAEMNGDSADPMIADAYAFGVRNFDARAALAAMVKGATSVGTGAGWDVARQDLDEYLTRGWVQADRRDKTSFDYTIGGSETLEYAIDDSAIARLAAALGDRATADVFARRAENWRHLFNPVTGYLAARAANGSFPTGPPFHVSNQSDIGQDGWEEGNSIQYSWSVPQNLRGLFDAMGGNRVVVSRLDSFFTHLNTSRKQPYNWAGNEPALGIPWEYDYAGAPWRTQEVVRRLTALYSATPNGEPGNDDLGALSSWYVWAALGLYPETPGRADLVLASPIFTREAITLASGRTIVVSARASSSVDRYVQSLVVSGVSPPNAACHAATNQWVCPWVPASIATTGGQLDFTLGPSPNRNWGTVPGTAPPSGEP